MDSWWQLGEGIGYPGNELSLWDIACPFCMEKGNFSLAYRAEKKKPNEWKRLYFDTYECVNCKGYVMCVWSAGSGLYDYRLLPWPLRVEAHPKHWPSDVGRFWMQAHRTLSDQNWDAAAVMARSALQAALREQSAEGRTLRDEIDQLSARGILPPIMREWADTLRQLGNEAAHPHPDQAPPSPADARDTVRFLDFFLEYLYDLPHQIAAYRAREAED